jgi:hypothetical protein
MTIRRGWNPARSAKMLYPDAAGSAGYGGPPEGTPCARNGEHVYRTLMARSDCPPESSLG